MSEKNPISKTALQDEDSQGLTAEHYKLIVENANEAIVVAQDGKLKFVNPKTEEITGFTRSELTDKPFKDLIHPEDAQMVAERHRMRLAGDELPHVYSFRIVDKGGGTRWVEINAVRLDWDGKPATLNFLNEITEHKRVGEESRKKMEEIEKLNGFMIGRELRIVDMKREINELLGRLGEEPRYKV